MLGEKYFRVLILVLVHCITLTLIFFKTSGLLFRIELCMFLFFLLISIIYLFGLFFEEGWSWVLIMLFFGINLVNLVVLKLYLTDNLVLFGILLVVDVIGFFMSIANIGEEDEDLEIEPYESEERKKLPVLPEIEVYHHDADSGSAAAERSAARPERAAHQAKASRQKPSRQSTGSRPRSSAPKASVLAKDEDIEPLSSLDSTRQDHFKDKIKIKYDSQGDKIEPLKVVRKPKKKRR